MTEHTSYPCPCCGYLIFDEPPGSYDICPICFWEDDVFQLRFACVDRSANNVSLLVGQLNYIEFGACESTCQPHARRPTSSDIRDPEWRVINLDVDNIEDFQPERIFIVNASSDIVIDKPLPLINDKTPYPDDRTQLYYWRPTYWRRTLSSES
ncbi:MULTISPECIES: CPCC family cysteine-rich protein [Nostocales]|uniref:Cysteine-rich CPCC domain-containing protein n=3 Tax=Nostocales TaxID=1161 RepID=A0A0C1NG32_9CYAN|nr:CPCC family cysteine-rich protein [Tolypothrix bouteillei]KAF3884751.1 hypothetical protein DA73_0400004155 [Tolypothrix bouteillei VB521301]